MADRTVDPMLSEQRSLLRFDDLSDDEVRSVLGRAKALRSSPPEPRRLLVALVFTTPSLRTRIGFAAAAHRLGGGSIDVQALRVDSRMSDPESLADTLRVAAGT